MTFHLVYPPPSSSGQSPVRVVEQTTGREVGWINRFLDREYVRRLADRTLRTYAHNLLHFVRWWESVHHTGDVFEAALAESTLLDYVRFQSSQLPRPSGSTINDRIALADRALRNEFPDAPCQIARGFHQAFLRRGPMGLGRPRMATSRVRVKEAKRTIIPLSVDEVARFWSSFHTSRDLAIVGLMLLQGLRSAEVLALNPDDLLLSEAQVRVRGKGSKLRFLPLAPETIQLLGHYLRLERPAPCSAALFVSLKGRARGVRMTLAGFRSLFRYHRRTTGVTLANPHRFRHYATSRTMPHQNAEAPICGLLSVVMKHSFRPEHCGQMDAACVGDTSRHRWGRHEKDCLLWEGTVFGPCATLTTTSSLPQPAQREATGLCRITLTCPRDERSGPQARGRIVLVQ